MFELENEYVSLKDARFWCGMNLSLLRGKDAEIFQYFYNLNN